MPKASIILPLPLPINTIIGSEAEQETQPPRPLESRNDIRGLGRDLLTDDLWYRLYLLNRRHGNRVPRRAVNAFRIDPERYDFNWAPPRLYPVRPGAGRRGGSYGRTTRNHLSGGGRW